MPRRPTAGRWFAWSHVSPERSQREAERSVQIPPIGPIQSPHIAVGGNRRLLVGDVARADAEAGAVESAVAIEAILDVEVGGELAVDAIGLAVVGEEAVVIDRAGIFAERADLHRPTGPGERGR